jgi:predicted deacylase
MTAAAFLSRLPCPGACRIGLDMSVSPVHCSAPLDAAHGKYPGHLAIPYSYNLGGWANLLVPICVIANGPGPTVLLMAGNHGDEYPGQVAIHHLWRQLEPEQVTGRLILIPTLSPPAALAATRLWPLDGRNFNRCFPGDPAGSPSQVLAHFLSSVLFPLADVVIDLHTGGRSMNFVPCAHMHLVDNPAMFAATEAFLTEFCFLYTDVAGAGLLPTEAERQGKLVITTELRRRRGRPRPVGYNRSTAKITGLPRFPVCLRRPWTLAAPWPPAMCWAASTTSKTRIGRRRWWFPRAPGY